MMALLELGGYGAYIWPCYILSFGFVIAVYLQAEKAQKRTRAKLAQLQTKD